ncbi:MAG: hypothetical protein PVJ13_11380, partial [Desulfobacterales bacterium]
MARFLIVLARGKRFFVGIGICLLSMMATGHRVAAEDQPKSFKRSNETGPVVAETISRARATWDTGWFQTEIFIILLEELGYTVAYPQTMDNLAFYLAAA